MKGAWRSSLDASMIAHRKRAEIWYDLQPTCGMHCHLCTCLM